MSIVVQTSVVAQAPTVFYTCTEPGGASVTCKGTITGPHGESSSFDPGNNVSAWEAGDWHIDITATDSAGRQSTRDVSYKVETQAGAVCDQAYSGYDVSQCLGIENSAPGSADGSVAGGLSGYFDNSQCPTAADGCAWDAKGHLAAEEFTLSDGTAKVIAVGSGSLRPTSSGEIIAVGSGAIIAVGSGSIIAVGSGSIIAVGSGSIIAVGSGSFSGLLGGGGLISTTLTGFSPGSMFASAGLLNSTGAGFAGQFVSSVRDKPRKPRLVPLISGTATITQAGGSATLVLRYTARGHLVIARLEKQNASLIEHHKKPHSLKLAVVVRFTPKSGKPTSVSKTITLTPRPAPGSKKVKPKPKHHK